jgi:hypothetical protein
MLHTLDIDGKFFVELLCDKCEAAGPTVPAEKFMDKKAREKAIELAKKNGFKEFDAPHIYSFLCPECMRRR